MTARRLFDRFEPVHAVTYFAPEARGAFVDAGFRGFWMSYFAARSAPLGIRSGGGGHGDLLQLRAGAGSARVASRLGVRLPGRRVAGPRGLGSGGATPIRRDRCQRHGPAADLLEKAARSAPLDGHPLFAANRALPWPDEPVAKLWHAATLLREHRGDGHVALLVGAGVSGRDSNVLHCASDRVPREFIMLSRQYDDDEWRACTDRLAARGVLDERGALTPAGVELKAHLEDGTDRTALTAFDALDDDELELLFRTLTPLTRKVVAGGDIPAATPMGLNRDDLDDDGANLR